MHSDDKHPISKAVPDAFEVEGHALHHANDQSTDSDVEQGEDLDVEGHMHPYLAEQVTRERHKDFLAEAQRDQQGMMARPSERDGGIMDKIRRRKEQ